jgi:hypothetical protein
MDAEQLANQFFEEYRISPKCKMKLWDTIEIMMKDGLNITDVELYLRDVFNNLELIIDDNHTSTA